MVKTSYPELLCGCNPDLVKVLSNVIYFSLKLLTICVLIESEVILIINNWLLLLLLNC